MGRLPWEWKGAIMIPVENSDKVSNSIASYRPISLTSFIFSSHIGLNGKEIADNLVKSTTTDALQGDACLTLADLSSIKRMELNPFLRVPPAHPWYFGKKPRLCHEPKGSFTPTRTNVECLASNQSETSFRPK
ncbi:hypothetical protein TNCV_1530631 [Trichonephila clavipes]|uniref:Uncharacterized protein n=1 Tax=Trichonephila clavipes TaxID=2585209 RepID=A0A8X6R6G3_TRICX|nr:hypothetical protein TNCV_1530631 [Trichonephila clavipes]